MWSAVSLDGTSPVGLRPAIALQKSVGSCALVLIDEVRQGETWPEPQPDRAPGETQPESTPYLYRTMLRVNLVHCGRDAGAVRRFIAGIEAEAAQAWQVRMLAEHVRDLLGNEDRAAQIEESAASLEGPSN